MKMKIRKRVGKPPEQAVILNGSWLLAIDPGIRGLGWALWSPDRTRGLRTEPLSPSRAGIITTRKRASTPWEADAVNLAMQLQGVCNSYGAFGLTVCMEMPEFRASDAVGHAAASKESLGMLYFVCGAIGVGLNQWTFGRTRYPRVRQWKGSLSKETVERRLSRAIGLRAADLTPLESHMWDAVGIGLWCAGHNLNDVKKFG